MKKDLKKRYKKFKDLLIVANINLLKYNNVIIEKKEYINYYKDYYILNIYNYVKLSYKF